MLRRPAVALATLLAAGTVVVLGPPAAYAEGPVTRPLSRVVDSLPVAREVRAGYAREKFPHWVDADDDCQDTRDEVLAAESLVPVRGCDVQRGRWESWYDGVTTRSSSDFDVDHLVPLAEAWDSGARLWNLATRQRFANDLRDPRSLVAVTAASNRSKGDRDVAEWLPPLHRCGYVRHWVAVKARWRLSVDPLELRVLRAQVRRCGDEPLRVVPAVVVKDARPSRVGVVVDRGSG